MKRRELLSAGILWVLLLLAVGVRSVLAHGEHGGAAPPQGGVSHVTVEGFQAELLTSPQPPRSGQENKIIVNILRDGSLEPVRDGKVLIGVFPLKLGGASHAQHNTDVDTNSGEDSPPLFPAPEAVWAGNYTLLQKLDQPGLHIVRVALLELGGKKFNPPGALEFRLNVAPAPGINWSFLMLLLTASAIGGGGLYWVMVRSRPGVEWNVPFNLLDIGWLNRFVRWKGFLPVLQIPVLILTLVIMLLGFFDIQDGGRNLATKLTWVVWWPGIIFTFIVVGRLWCVVCPFGALNEGAAKWAKPKMMFPKSLRSLWLATFLFVILTWADEQLGIIRSPHMTAWLILLLALVSVGTGIVFQRRSFCRYLCPITGLQGLYSMASPIELRAADRSLCAKGCDQDCYRGSEKAAGCPMFEFPMTMDRNTYCNFCFECVKDCPKDNLVLRFRKFGSDLWSSARRRLDETYLALAMVGITTIVTAQMLSSWPGWISRLSRLIPLPLRTLMKPVTYLALTESVVFFIGSLVVIPLLGYLAAWIGRRMAGDHETEMRKTFVTLGYMFIPVGLAMHLAHNFSHLFLEGGGVVPALQRTLNSFTSLDAGEPDWMVTPLVSPDIIHGLEMATVLAGLALSIAVGYRLAVGLFKQRETIGKAMIPLIILSLLFTVVNLYLLSQPMAMRHSS